MNVSQCLDVQRFAVWESSCSVLHLIAAMGLNPRQLYPFRNNIFLMLTKHSFLSFSKFGLTMKANGFRLKDLYIALLEGICCTYMYINVTAFRNKETHISGGRVSLQVSVLFIFKNFFYMEFFNTDLFSFVFIKNLQRKPLQTSKQGTIT